MRIFGSFQMTAGRVVTPKDVNSMFSHLFELAAALVTLGSKQSFAGVSLIDHLRQKTCNRWQNRLDFAGAMSGTV